MSDPELRARADRRFEDAITRSDARDPRGHYRDQLKALRAEDPQRYERAVTYFEDSLLPAVAAEGSDPIAEWLEYGRYLATLTSPGRTVMVDETGRARDFDRDAGAGKLILHIPSGSREPVLVLGLPRELSAAQKATYELLVRKTPD